MRTLTHYEAAWNMHRAGIKVGQIASSLNKHRATIYRWIKDIKIGGIRQFLKLKKTAKHRRQRSRTPEYVVQKIVDIRNQFGWCGAKIKKELYENHGISLALSTIYRYLHKRFTKFGVGIKKYNKHQALVTASSPREVVEHDTVDLGGKKNKVYAYTAIDIFTKEPSVIIASDLTMDTGVKAFLDQKQFYGDVELHQSDNGSEFQSLFKLAIEITGSKHRYSRPYKKNEQSHIENFNKALRNECFPGAEYQERDIPRLQQIANSYTKHYIERRWHMGLPDMMTPKQFKELYLKDPELAKLKLAKVYKKSHLG